MFRSSLTTIRNMDLRILCYIIYTIIYIKPLAAHNEHVPYPFVQQVAEKTNESDKKVNVNIDTEVKEDTKALFYLVKADQLNDHLLDRLIEKLTLIQPKPPQFEPYAAGDANKAEKDTRRLEWLDKAKFAMKSMPKYEKFIGDQLASDYKKMAHVLFGGNTKEPTHSNNNANTEKYLATMTKYGIPLGVKLGKAKNEEVSTSSVKVNHETETTQPQFILNYPNSNRRFDIVPNLHISDPENYKINNTKEPAQVQNNEDNSQVCESNLFNNNNMHEKEKLTADKKVQTETEANTAEDTPPIVKLLKNSWASVMRNNAAKLARKQALVDHFIAQSNAKAESNANSESNVKDGIEKKNKKNEAVNNVGNVAHMPAKEEDQPTGWLTNDGEKTIDKGMAPKQNRRLLDNAAKVNDGDEKTTNAVDDTNLWCSSGLLCRKTGVPVCGRDRSLGYARFEDICQLLKVNCYYKHHFVPVFPVAYCNHSEEPK